MPSSLSRSSRRSRRREAMPPTHPLWTFDDCILLKLALDIFWIFVRFLYIGSIGMFYYFFRSDTFRSSPDGADAPATGRWCRLRTSRCRQDRLSYKGFNHKDMSFIHKLMPFNYKGVHVIMNRLAILRMRYPWIKRTCPLNREVSPLTLKISPWVVRAAAAARTAPSGYAMSSGAITCLKLLV